MKHLILPIIAFLLSVTSIQAQSSPRFYFSTNSLNLKPGQSQTVTLYLDTAGRETTGVDAVFTLDPNVVRVTQVVFKPDVYTKSFFVQPESFTPLRLTSSFIDASGSHSGSGEYAYVTLQAVTVGSTQLKFSCTPNSTNDTNIAERFTALDVVDCNSLSSLNLTVSSTTSGGGDDDDDDDNDTGGTSTPTDPSCSAPGTPSNLKAYAIDHDSILLRWDKASGANNYALMFGTQPGQYSFGASQIGDTDQLMVNFLSPAVTYYFALAGTNDCTISSFINTSGRTLSGGSGRTTTTTTPTTTTPATNYPTFAPTNTSQPFGSPLPTPEIFLTPEELDQIPSLDAPLPPVDDASGQDALASDEPITEESSRSPLVYVALFIIFLIILLIIFLILKRRRQDDDDYSSNLS